MPSGGEFGISKSLLEIDHLPDVVLDMLVISGFVNEVMENSPICMS